MSCSQENERKLSSCQAEIKDLQQFHAAELERLKEELNRNGLSKFEHTHISKHRIMQIHINMSIHFTV